MLLDYDDAVGRLEEALAQVLDYRYAECLPVAEALLKELNEKQDVVLVDGATYYKEGSA